MTRYFIDYQDGDDVHLDSEGSNLSSFDVAKKEALGVLSELIKFVLPKTGSREIMATVRDESDTKLYRATLIYHAENLDQSLRFPID